MEKSKILVLGTGGREHSLCWHLKQSGFEVECAPGSDALSQIVPTWSFSDFHDLESKILSHKIASVIVGPEKYLSEGVADWLIEKGISVFGPTQKAAQLECDKAFAKSFLARNQIPTAASETILKVEEIEEKISKFHPPFVVKAAGLAAGKGVWIGDNRAEAIHHTKQFLKDHSSVVIEEFLRGEEISYFVMIDGENSLFLGAAQDHKRLLDNDQGPNTGGMGAYSPVPFLKDSLHKEIEETIVTGTLNALKKENLHYRGFLFIGLMISGGKPYVLEFNCRLGDPETQSLLIRLKDSVPALIDRLKIERSGTASYHQGASLNIVVAAQGYPEKPQVPFDLKGIENSPPDCEIFHSGTRWDSERKVWIATGGRLFSVATRAKTLADCQNKIYPWLESLPFLNQVHFRRDIGAGAFRHLLAGENKSA